MRYPIFFTKTAKEQFDLLDRYAKGFVSKWLSKHIEEVEDPCLFAEPLFGDWEGRWKYRIGVYRLIACTKDKKLLILVIDDGQHNQGTK
jgi:mRNA interferase RelE/StbE